MIIDFHTHVFPDKIAEKTIDALKKKASIEAFSSGTVDGIIEKMAEADVNIAINLPVLTNPASFESLNRYARLLNENFSHKERRIISFAGIHPLCEDIEGKMEEIKSAGFLGVKIHPDYQGSYFDDEGYIRIIKNAKALDLIVITHAGLDVGYVGCPIHCTPKKVLRVLEKVDHKKLVLAHLGGVEALESMIENVCGTDVYLDTSYVLRFIGKDNFIRILEKHGSDKLLFGSDSPWSDMAADVEILRSYKLGKETEEKILCGNAKKLLGIR